MINLLIVDNEPFVQTGIKSMLDWNAFGIHLCATASNGTEAFEYIQTYQPEIVITDIQLPIMDGLELIQVCKENYGDSIVFIVLTNCEDFTTIRTAMRYGASEYLLKMELTADSLKQVLLPIVEKLKKQKENAGNHFYMKVFRDKFFIRLLHNLFDSQQQFLVQKEELQLNFNYSKYVCAYCKILKPESKIIDSTELIKLYNSTAEMVAELLNKYLPCYTTSLDIKHFSIIFCLSDEQIENWHALIKNIVETIFDVIYKYFNVTIYVGIGGSYHSPFHISTSFQEARQIMPYLTNTKKCLFYKDISESALTKNIFNISLFKNDIVKAFEEFDTESLMSIISQIIDMLNAYPAQFTQALDAASNILYLSISLLPNGETSVVQIFSEFPDSYRSLYQQTSVQQIVDWLHILCKGLCNILELEKKNYKNNTILKIQKYINTHIHQKLSLNEVADAFGLTPNYLSTLFKKNSDSNFTEYVNNAKIQKAKKLLQENNSKIYEIAQQLGYENAFYFSKVFKKIEGCSPRDYVNRLQEQDSS